MAGGQLDADGAYDEIAATPGAGPAHPSELRGYDDDDAAIGLLSGFVATPFATRFGGRVGAGDVSGDGREDVLCGAGPDAVAGSSVGAYTYDGTLAALPGGFIAFPGTSHGVSVGAGALGY